MSKNKLIGIMKSFRLFLLVLLFTASMPTIANAYVYSDGTNTVIFTKTSDEKVTLQYLGITADFSLIPERTNGSQFAFRADTLRNEDSLNKDEFVLSYDCKIMMLSVYEANPAIFLTLNLDTDDNGSQNGNNNEATIQEWKNRLYERQRDLDDAISDDESHHSLVGAERIRICQQSVERCKEVLRSLGCYDY